MNSVQLHRNAWKRSRKPLRIHYGLPAHRMARRRSKGRSGRRHHRVIGHPAENFRPGRPRLGTASKPSRTRVRGAAAPLHVAAAPFAAPQAPARRRISLRGRRLRLAQAMNFRAASRPGKAGSGARQGTDDARPRSSAGDRSRSDRVWRAFQRPVSASSGLTGPFDAGAGCS